MLVSLPNSRSSLYTETNELPQFTLPPSITLVIYMYMYDIHNHRVQLGIGSEYTMVSDHQWLTQHVAVHVTVPVLKAGHPSVLLFILPCINHVHYVYCLSGLPFFLSYFCHASVLCTCISMYVPLPAFFLCIMHIRLQAHRFLDIYTLSFRAE